MTKSRSEHLDRWWEMWSPKVGLRNALKCRKRIIVSSRIQRFPFVFEFLQTTVRPSDKLQLFSFNDDYSFGIIQATPHGSWYKTKAARLKNEADYSYSSKAIFNTLPWPQEPSVERIDAVAEAGREVRRVRQEALGKVRGGLRAVYRTLELPGKNPLKDAHATLDSAVLAAYGFSPRKDLLAQLLALNLDVAHRIDVGQSVTSPGVPTGYPDPARLITDDCVRAE